MYKAPSRRKSSKEIKKPNLIPILDSVFIFIFFLLMSANFIKIFEIPSDVPIVSNQPPPKTKKNPLALTLKIYRSSLVLSRGVPSKTIRSFKKNANGDYDLESLHNYLVNLKQRYSSESSIVFEPVVDLSYEEIVKIMDSVRYLRKTDADIYIKDKSGLDVKVDALFNKIIFGNIQS